MKQTKRFLSAAVALVALAMVNMSMTTDDEPASRIVENGGSGPFKAVMKTEPTLAAHTIFVPQDLAPFSDKNPLPVLVWGNGACANSPFEHVNFLNEIASHGYIVVATGYMPKEGERYRGAMSTTEQQLESMDWVIAQNADKNSPYYKKIDVPYSTDEELTYTLTQPLAPEGYLRMEDEVRLLTDKAGKLWVVQSGTNAKVDEKGVTLADGASTLKYDEDEGVYIAIIRNTKMAHILVQNISTATNYFLKGAKIELEDGNGKVMKDDEDKDCLLPLDSMRMIEASDYRHTYRLPHD